MVRHAKSTWDDSSLADRDRPLSPRGKRDAEAMGKRLANQGLVPDLILTSPAKRARKTARRLGRELDLPKKRISRQEMIYSGGPEQIHQMLLCLDGSFHTVLIVGHNPTLSDLAARLTTPAPGELPTCGVLALTFSITQWSDLKERAGKVEFFYRPRDPSTVRKGPLPTGKKTAGRRIEE